MKRSFLVQTRSLEYLHCLRLTRPQQIQQVRGTGALTISAIAGIPESLAYAPEKALLTVLDQEAKGYRITASQTKKLSEAFDQASEECASDFSPWWINGGADGSEEDMRRRSDLPLTSNLASEKVPLLAAEFLALRFIGYIRYVSLHMRNQLTFISLGFVLSLLAVKSYPFQQRHTISWTLVGLFAVLTVGIIWIFADMDRDAILSRMSNTKAGSLDAEFFVRAGAFGALPLITILASQFPSISNFLFSWIRPGLEALK